MHPEASAGARVVCLMGPTGTGKSNAALALAAGMNAEIVSVDSALVYRGLDIGTAKPGPHERRQVVHHLIDICDPAERYSAARFRDDALRVIADIHARERVALLTGGTGLYFRALESGLADLPDADEALRTQVKQDYEVEGAARLHERLAAVDPYAAARIHPNDPQRLIRALEVHVVTGRPLSALWAEQAARGPGFEALKVVIAPADRGRLHARLERRFDLMLERGFVNEVHALRARSELSLDCASMRSVGYRAVWRYLDGEYDSAEMRARGVAATRQLAKRQLTWLRREQGAAWVDSEAPDLLERLQGLIFGGREFKRRPN